MGEDLFIVLDGNTVLASNMTIDNAMILVKGYFERYYEERRLSLTIERMGRTENYQNQEAADGKSTEE